MNLFLIIFFTIYLISISTTLLVHFFTNRYLSTFDSKVKTSYWIKIWEEYENKEIPEKCIKKIKSPYYLVGLNNFLNTSSDQIKNTFLTKYVNQITKAVKGMNNIEKAYFADMFNRFDTPVDAHTASLYQSLMLSFLFEKSVHLRENALQTIYEFNDYKAITTAYTLLSAKTYLITKNYYQMDYFFIPKTNTFSSKFNRQSRSFLTVLEVATINFLSRLSYDEYQIRLIKEFNRTRFDSELVDFRCSVLRFLGKGSKQKEVLAYIRAFLNSFINEATSDEWEELAVAITSLGFLPYQKSAYNLLKRTLTSPNWFVRINSAKSLYKLNLSEEEISELMNLDDQFAVDAINYVFNEEQ